MKKITFMNNNLCSFGSCKYDSETGRFLSVDPFFESFPNQTPYQYAYNSPIQYKDPSGLAPEEEKKERVLHNVTMDDVWSMFEISNITCTETSDDQAWDFYCQMQLGLWGTGKFTWRSRTPANPWALQAALNYSCWGRLDYSFGNGAWRPNLSELLPDKRGLYDGKPPLINNNPSEQPRLGTIGGSRLFENYNASGIDNSAYTIGLVMNVVGTYASMKQYSYTVFESWKGINGKWYSKSWGGNGYTGARSLALGNAELFKTLSRYTFYLGAVSSGINGGFLLFQGEYIGAAKSGVDITFSAIATFGGPYGMIIGGSYYVMDFLGVFSPIQPWSQYGIMNPFVNDNTYYAPPMIKWRPR
jgi:RHS repeat-associated protein